MNLKELRRVADEFHGKQQYGRNNYIVHLEEVRDVLTRFDFPASTCEKLHKSVYLHDLFEDTDLTPEKATSWGIDDQAIDWAKRVTDEPGETRKERKAKTYLKIRGKLGPTILKLADRIANVESEGKIDMYREEYPDFRKALCEVIVDGADARLVKMWEHLDNLLK